MTCISGKVKHVCCRMCWFIVVLALQQDIIPSVLAQDSGRVPMELMSWGAGGPKLELHIGEPPAKPPSLVNLLVNDVPWTDPSLPRQSGRFSVSAPRGHGLMAVIQILNLRADTSVLGSGLCKDYIRFSDVTSGVSSPNICGELKKENKSFIPENLIGPRVFHSPSGKLDIYYQSDKGEEQESPPTDKNELRAISQKSRHVVEVVFTAYSECLADTFRDQMKCGDKCITYHLHCDMHINCGFEEDFAADERNCSYADYGRRQSGAGGRPPYLVSLYLGAALFLVIIVIVAFYHRHTTYQRIKNIPT